MEEIKQKALNYLRDETNWVSMICGKLEAQSKIPREQIAGVAGGLFALYLVLGYFAELLCNFVGFAYPAYASMVAIESTDKNDDTQWLTYWTVYAVFSLIDFGAEVIVGWFPFYWLAKCVFLIYLYHPLTMGAHSMYVNYARPIIQLCSGAVSKASAAMPDAQPSAAAPPPSARLETAAAPPPGDPSAAAPPPADAGAPPPPPM